MLQAWPGYAQVQCLGQKGVPRVPNMVARAGVCLHKIGLVWCNLALTSM